MIKNLVADGAILLVLALIVFCAVVAMWLGMPTWIAALIMIGVMIACRIYLARA